MEILKHGNLAEDFSWEVTCRVCESVLKVLPSDVQRDQYSGDMREPGSSYDRLHCECPVCASRVFVANWHDVPEVVRQTQLRGVARALQWVGART